MHKSLNKYRNSRGFTLVELLVVIVIIAILCALLLPAIAGARRYAKRVTAASEVKNLETAWKKYYEEYHKWPSRGSLGGESDPERNAVAIVGDVADILMGVDVDGNNPKQLAFMEFKKERLEDGDNPVNPWRAPHDPDQAAADCFYYVKFDANFDNKINASGNTNNPPAETLLRPVIVWTIDSSGRVIGSWNM